MAFQAQKNLKWNELLRLLDLDPDWYKKPETERYRKITTLGREIFQQGMKNNPDKIDEQKYLVLVGYGYTLNEIAKEFDVTKNTLLDWRKNKGYTKKRVMEEVQ
ncbi:MULTISPECIES: hypothetical protein [unclassified Enterococcus]|uniref:hypothetical protein n=1 Tax=unclassified Enterococcus TaxID=2608891 RepID=UPI001CE1272A|nr:MULTISPECIES: hypothetical protein [unclassified Enterococcus]MCA5014549.1 hypothetical protein [Enterococcus sp. S23]MCA5017802.1 hypothetical protein [Enterococcus sp. S22(2020)]